MCTTPHFTHFRVFLHLQIRKLMVFMTAVSNTYLTNVTHSVLGILHELGMCRHAEAADPGKGKFGYFHYQYQRSWLCGLFIYYLLFFFFLHSHVISLQMSF